MNARRPKKSASVELTRSSAAEYLTFVAATGDDADSLEMRYEDENIWLTQKMMATLYGVDIRTVSEHLKRVFLTGEMTQEATIRNFRIVQREGARDVAREVQHYSLQAFIPLHSTTMRVPKLLKSFSR